MTEENINQWYAECIAAREEYRTEAALLRAQVERLTRERDEVVALAENTEVRRTEVALQLDAAIEAAMKEGGE